MRWWPQAEGMGRSLALAATAIASGFLAFAPTNYVGVSQLGVIAGIGLFIALALNLTVLPSFIALLSPKSEVLPPDRGRLDSLDAFMLGHRRLVVGTGVAAAAGFGGAAAVPALRLQSAAPEKPAHGVGLDLAGPDARRRRDPRTRSRRQRHR